MLTFYKNKSQTFECKVEIEGTDSANSESRLILIPDNDNKKIFFEGKVSSGKCKVEIPPLKNISDVGKLKLEIIIDDMLFSPWNSNYEIKEQIKVESVELLSPTKKKVSIIENDVKLKQNKSNVSVKSTPTKNRKKESILKQNISQKNKNIVKKYINQYKSKPTNDRSIIKEFATTMFEPKKETIRWGKSVLSDINKDISKTIMYMYEK